MSKPQLIRTDGPMPPAGFTFLDRLTGKSYKDLNTFFDSRVKQIVRDRLANRRLIANEKHVDPVFVAIELSEYTCARLNGNSTYCTGGSRPQANKAVQRTVPAPVVSKDEKCKFCGSVGMVELICWTCGGKRVGWRCAACGKQSK